MKTLYKRTAGKVRSIFLSLVWYAIDKKKNIVTPNSKESQYCQHCRESEHKRLQQ